MFIPAKDNEVHKIIHSTLPTLTIRDSMMKNFFFRSCCTALAGLTGLSMVGVSPVAANERHITCGSLNYGYNYCRIYTGGRARLVHQISHKPCTEGDTWGYDSQGIWVDKGCRADFVVDEAYGSGWNGGYNNGYNSRHDYSSSSHHDDDDNIGAALGVAAGVAILGAILGSAGSSETSTNSHYEDRHNSRIPSWAIGTFQGHNSKYNSEVELTITPSGQVYTVLDGHRYNGTFDGRILRVGDASFEVERTNDGLTTIQEGDYRNKVHYYRYR
jgi:hypothetical protein